MFGGPVYSASHRGAIRPENQDALLCRRDLDLYAVADGAGGHEHGRAAADAVIACVDALPAGLAVGQRVQELRRGIGRAHAQLLLDGSAASTVAVLLLEERFFAALWVGDSRIYLWRAGALMQLTHDHSLVQEMVDAGTLTEAEARTHPKGNIITRAVGGSAGELVIDKRTGEVMPGDRFLLCSDGLTKAMADDEICQMLGSDGDLAATMLETALRRRARDNVSVVVVCRD